MGNLNTNGEIWNHENFGELARLIKNSPDGFTVDVGLHKLKKGYAVGITDNVVRAYQAPRKAVEMTFFMSRIKTKYQKAIGGWLDTKTNKYYVDGVVIVPDKAKAMELGSALGQKAIFNLETMTELRITA